VHVDALRANTQGLGFAAMVPDASAQARPGRPIAPNTAIRMKQRHLDIYVSFRTLGISPVGPFFLSQHLPDYIATGDEYLDVSLANERPTGPRRTVSHRTINQIGRLRLESQMHTRNPGGRTMDEPREFALEAAKRILNNGNTKTPPAANSQLFTDLAEMIRQRMTGENLLEENSRWFLLPACGTQLGDRWLTGRSH